MDVVPVPLFPEDVKMVNTAQTVPSTGHIKWADEQMDTDHGGHQAGGHGGGALDRGGFGDGHRESVGGEEVNIIRNNRLGKILQVTTGQSNG